METAIDLKIFCICNPDVVLREEEESGALLFNQDSNQVKVINTTGLCIWHQFTWGNNLASVKPFITKSFGVPQLNRSLRI